MKVDREAGRRAMEAECRRIAELIRPELPEGQGFALFLFDFGAEGNLAYVSSAQRAGMVKAVREWLERVERETS